MNEVKERAQRIVRRQQLFNRFREYVYGALAIIWIFFAMLIASDGMIAVGVIGSVAVGLVIAGVAYILGDYEQ